MIDEVLPAALDGERLDRVVAMLTGCTRSEASAAIDVGGVVVDGRTAGKPSSKVRAGQRICIADDPHVELPPPGPDASVEFAVVYEDDDIIVIDKPAGLVVHPGPGHRGATLVNGLLARWPNLAEVGEPDRPGIVHRLDRGTSGLLVVARNERARLDLIDQLATHQVERVYDAMVWGRFATSAGTIDAPVGRSRRNPLLMTVAADGRPARTHYEVEQSFDEPAALARLTCRLETGRTHQIRVHLRSIGHPVVGDDLYGGVRPGLRADRPFLHARHLEFRHPGTGSLVAFDQALPDDLVLILERCRPAASPPTRTAPR